MTRDFFNDGAFNHNDQFVLLSIFKSGGVFFVVGCVFFFSPREKAETFLL